MIEEAAKGNHTVRELAKSRFADYTGALIKANPKLGLQGDWAGSHRQCSQCVGRELGSGSNSAKLNPPWRTSPTFASGLPWKEAGDKCEPPSQEAEKQNSLCNLLDLDFNVRKRKEGRGKKILSQQGSWFLAKAEKTSGTPTWISWVAGGCYLVAGPTFRRKFGHDA